MSDEYISKAKATSFPLANDQYDHVHADPHFIAGCETYKEWLNSIPAANVVEVRHGRWNGGATGWECSVCTIESNNTYPHCPYCGAVMDGGQDDV